MNIIIFMMEDDNFSNSEENELIIVRVEEPTICVQQALRDETLCGPVRPRQSPIKNLNFSRQEKDRNNSLKIWFQENLQIREDEISQHILVLHYSGVSSPQQLKNKLLRDESYLSRLDFVPSYVLQIFSALGLPAPLSSQILKPQEVGKHSTTATVGKDMKKWLQAHTTADVETIDSYDFVLRFSSISTEEKLKAKLMKDINFLHERDFSLQHIKQIRRALSLLCGSEEKASSPTLNQPSPSAVQSITGGSSDILDESLSPEDRALLSHWDISLTVFQWITKYFMMRMVHGHMRCFQRIPTGDFYHGSFDENLCRDGDGLCVYKNGDYYEGRFLRDDPDGHGEMTYSNGSSYRGMFSQGLRHGKGVQTYPNGDLFRGMYHLGASHFFYCMSQRSGHGRCEYASGGCYEGEYYLNRKDGRGVMLSADGSRYEGQFKDGKKCGKGVLQYANQDTYSGEFFEDRKHGQGRYQYHIDGSVYEGGFLNGLAHGYGSIRRPIKMKTEMKGGVQLLLEGTSSTASSPTRRFVQKEGEWREGKMIN